MEKLVLTFPSFESRDRFIDRVAPERKATDTPGLFLLPTGDHLGVLCFEVTLYPVELEFPKFLTEVRRIARGTA